MVGLWRNRIAPVSHIFEVEERTLVGVSHQDLMEELTAGATENLVRYLIENNCGNLTRCKLQHT